MSERESTIRDIIIRDIIIALLVAILAGVIVAIVTGQGRFAPQPTMTNIPTSTVQQISVPILLPTLPLPIYPQLLSTNTLIQILDETDTERVEITIGRLREFCDQGVFICNDHSSSNWSVTGPAVIATDPLQQPIDGARVIKVNKDSTGNWLPNWPIGLFYIPEGQNVHVPNPGVAYPLEEALPAKWVIR